MVGPSAPGAIEVRGLSRRFGSRPVLDGTSLSIGPGTLAAVVGPNGSGKTTLLRVLAGVLEADAGSVEVAGAPPGQGRTGFVPPGDRGLYWRLTGIQNLEFFARLAGVPSDAAVEVARALGGGDLLGLAMGTCSSGQRRRIVIARALAGSPPVLLVDEPWAELDDAGREAVTALFGTWTDGGGVVLYAAPAEEEGPDPQLRFRIDGGVIEEEQ